MAENVEPEPKKLRLSLQKPRPKSRFEHVDEKEISVICRRYVPPNTEKNTRWGMTMFNDWKSSRNRESEEIMP